MRRNVLWQWRLLAHNGLWLKEQTLSTLKRRRLHINSQLGITFGTVQFLRHAWELFWTVLLGMDWNHTRKHHNCFRDTHNCFTMPRKLPRLCLIWYTMQKDTLYDKMNYACKSDWGYHSALHFKETWKKENLIKCKKLSIKKSWLIPLKTTWLILFIYFSLFYLFPL